MLFECLQLSTVVIIFQACVLGGSTALLEIEEWIASESQFVEDDDDFDFNYGVNVMKRDVNYDPKKYSQTCRKALVMKKNTKIRIVSIFHGEKQYLPGTSCDWSFLGSTECIPQISCDTIDLRSSADCQDEYLIASDGVAGGFRLCGENSKTKPQKPSTGNDLFVVFKTQNSDFFSRLFKGIRCEVSCDKNGIAEKLPENNDIFKEEARCACGISKPGASSARIVGGQEASPFEFPWIVAIVFPHGRRPYCGGSLLNSQFVLTAAHCFAPENSTKFYSSSSSHVLVHLHDTHKTDSEEQTVRASITQIICHPKYGMEKSFDYDYCILKLDREINMMEHTPVCLGSYDREHFQLDGKLMTVAGWGRQYDGGPLATVLLKVQVPIMSQAECIRVAGGAYVSSRMICAGYPRGMKDACAGDSGGPLMNQVWVKGDEVKYEQVGAVSWGEGCAAANNPGIYSNVPALTPWIKVQAMSGTWCKNKP